MTKNRAEQILPTFRLNICLHQTRFISFTILVGGMWSAIKLLPVTSCRLPQWWQPWILPSFWICALSLPVAASAVATTFRTGREPVQWSRVCAKAPVVMMEEGNAVRKPRLSNSTINRRLMQLCWIIIASSVSSVFFLLLLPTLKYSTHERGGDGLYFEDGNSFALP